MRLVSFRTNGVTTAGVLLGDEVLPAAALGDAISVRGLLAAHDSEGLRTLGEHAERSRAERLALETLSLQAPVPDPQKIICIGLNYADHAKEAGVEPPTAPMWFGKFANSLIGDGEPIVLPGAHPDYVDYEAELALVIGATVHDVAAEHALGFVAGVMPFNDVTARDLQLQNPLWTSGKAVDTFAPCGPALVTLDEVGDLDGLGLRTRIDGETVQEGTTADLIFGAAELVSWLSRTITLVPGDIIATGTPAGVGGPRGIFLRDASTVEVEIDGIGTLSNPVRRG